MAKCSTHIDVLVLGEHPSAFLAAALLRVKSKLSVLHATIPGEPLRDRLVLVNPAFFSLHPLMEPMRRKLDSRGIFGLQFVADDRGVVTEFRSKSGLGAIAHLKEVRQLTEAVAVAQGVEFAKAKQLQVHRVTEHGVEVSLNGHLLRPTALVLAGSLPADQQRILGMPEQWERGVLHRYTYAMIRGTRLMDLNSRPLMPMSLDLRGMLRWAWLMPGQRHVQLAVEQPLETIASLPPADLLRHWLAVLQKHGVVRGALTLADDDIQSMDLPLAGALAHEGLANRTLLVGPAGGFYTANTEDVYPCCWSAVFAADILKKAIGERHLQDALQPYRQKWRTTLGDYLRGPQQNLRFLLPLVYRNQVMTNRVGEAILVGHSVVR